MTRRALLLVALAASLTLLGSRPGSPEFAAAPRTSPGLDPSAAENGNLLFNPGFEVVDDGGRAAGWQATVLYGSADNVVLARDHRRSNSGAASASIRIHGVGRAIWSQTVGVVSGVVYEFSGVVAFEDLTEDSICRLQVVFRDDNGESVSFVDLAGHSNGQRGFSLDFPARMLIRAPANATSAEVNGLFEGPGIAWFDDLSFVVAPTGRIEGTVTDAGGPLEGVRVFLWGDPWGRPVEATTGEDGRYLLMDVPVTHPRYIVVASKEGYRTQPQGDIAVAHGTSTSVDFVLVEGTDPADSLIVGHAFLVEAHVQTRIDVPDYAELPMDETGYPESIRTYLASDAYITADDSQIQALSKQTVASMPNESRRNAAAVAWAVYVTVSTTLNHDAVYGLNQAYRDVTSGIWQTIQPGGWCWSRNLYDWLYAPSELLTEGTGICIEHSWLCVALLRAANIPARARVGSAQFWLQLENGDGAWFEMSTNGGSNTFRETGILGAGFGGSATPVYTSATSEPFLQEDWDWQQPGLWRETHPWTATYALSPAGEAQALAALAAYAADGTPPRSTGTRTPAGAYEIHCSQVELCQWSLASQTTIDFRFPMPTVSQAFTDRGEWCYFTNHPECVLDTYVETVSHAPTQALQRWQHIVVDVSSLVEP